MRALFSLSQHLEMALPAHDERGALTQPAEPEGRRASAKAAVGGSANRELATSVRPTNPKPDPYDRIEGLDNVIGSVIRKCKGVGLKSNIVRHAVRNLQYTARNGMKPAEVADLVLNQLIDGGLLEEVKDGANRKGRHVRHCRWKPWAAIRGDPASDAFRARLGLGEADFA